MLDFLDDKSASKNYSTRAVAATYCVGGTERSEAVHHVLVGSVRHRLSARSE
jgi:hypothetical protein